jgi:hypothetical protein
MQTVQEGGIIVSTTHRTLISPSKVICHMAGQVPPKGMIELEKSIQTADPRVIIFSPDDARHTSVPLLAGPFPRPADELTLDSNFRARANAGASSTVDAEIELTPAVLGTHPECHFGIKR